MSLINEEGEEVLEEIYEYATGLPGRFDRMEVYDELWDRFGWELIAVGSYRLILRPPNEYLNYGESYDYVVKVEHREEGLEGERTTMRHQNTTEIATWKKVAGDIDSSEPYHRLNGIILPVISHDKDSHRWLAMERVDDPGPEGVEIEGFEGNAVQAATEVQQDLIDAQFYYADLHTDNVGVKEGEVYIFDYGEDFVYMGDEIDEVNWGDFVGV